MSKKSKRTIVNKVHRILSEYSSKAKKILTKKYSTKAITTGLGGKIKFAAHKINIWLKDLLFQEYYGIKLFKPRTILAVYLLLLVSLYSLLIVLPKSFIEASGYINFTEQALTILTVLLTVLLSAGLALLNDDTRGWALARKTIVRDIVRLRGLIITCLIIVAISITPHFIVWGYSLKLLLSPILIISFVFILDTYARIYFWLSDLAADPSFFGPQIDDGEKKPRSYTGSSYRFARIVHLVHYLGGDSRDAWQAVLEKRIPYGYEELLHEEFFKGVEDIIQSKNRAAYGDLSVRLEIYDKYYDRRNLDSWRFYIDYVKRFFIIYSSVSKITDEDRGELWRGKSALKNISEKLVSDSMNPEGSQSLFEAMDTYLEDRDLLMLGDRQRINEDSLVKHFLNEYFEKVFKDDLDTYDLEYYFHKHPHWQVTYSTLFEDHFNITYVIEKEFKDWLFKKLGALNQKESLYDVDSLFSTHFSEADPLTMADFYWLLYQAKNTTDSDLIVSLIKTNPRPFGLMGRSLTLDSTDDRDAQRRDFIEFQNSQINSAVKLFATRYKNYFLNFWNLDELIQKLQSSDRIASSGDDLDDEMEKIRIEHFYGLLVKVRELYDEDASTKRQV